MSYPTVKIEKDTPSGDFIYYASDGTHLLVPVSAVVTRPCPVEKHWGQKPWHSPGERCQFCDGSGQVPSWVFYCEDDEGLTAKGERIVQQAVFHSIPGLPRSESQRIAESVWPAVLRLLRGEAS